MDPAIHRSDIFLPTYNLLWSQAQTLSGCFFRQFFSRADFHKKNLRVFHESQKKTDVFFYGRKTKPGTFWFTHQGVFCTFWLIDSGCLSWLILRSDFFLLCGKKKWSKCFGHRPAETFDSDLFTGGRSNKNLWWSTRHQKKRGKKNASAEGSPPRKKTSKTLFISQVNSTQAAFSSYLDLLK